MKIRSANDARFYFEIAAFASFKIFGTQDQIVQPKSIIHEQESKKVVTSEFDDVFVTKEHKEEKPKVVEINKNVQPKVIKDISLDTVFNEIACNANKTSKIKADEFIKHIKELTVPGVFNYLITADKVLFASNNGMVLMFEDDVDAELLNSKYKDYNFLTEIKKHFKQPLYVFGFSKEKLVQLSNTFKELKKQGQTFNEPSLEPLNDVLKSNNSVEQIALEIFGN